MQYNLGRATASHNVSYIQANDVPTHLLQKRSNFLNLFPGHVHSVFLRFHIAEQRTMLSMISMRGAQCGMEIM